MRNTETAVESMPIRALGSLFRVTESYLWDDAFVGFSEAPVHPENLDEESTDLHGISFACSKISPTLNGYYGVYSSHISNGSVLGDHFLPLLESAVPLMGFLCVFDYMSVEDLELSQQMDALGLPVSFSTNKEKRNRATSAKRKGMVAKSLSHREDIENRLTEVSRESEHWNLGLSGDFQDSLKMTVSYSSTNEKIETSRDNYEEEHNIPSLCSDAMVNRIADNLTIKELDCALVSGKTYLMRNADVNPVNAESEILQGNALEGTGPGHYEGGESDFKQDKDKVLGSAPTTCFTVGCTNTSVDIGTFQKRPDPYESSMVSSMDGCNFVEDFFTSKCAGDMGDWMVVWDSFYMRNYFYNLHTHESTWYPPPGLEYLAVSWEPNEMLADAAEQDSGLGSASGAFILDMCRLQEDNFFKEVISGGKLSSQTSQEDIIRSNRLSGSSVSDTTSDSSKCQNGHVQANDYPEIAELSKSQFPLFPSGDKDQSESSQNRHDQVDSVKNRSSDLLVAGELSKLDELNVNESLENLERNVACQEACNVLDDMILKFHSRNSSSSTTTSNEADMDENWRSMPEMHMTPMADGLTSNRATVVKKKAKVRRIRSHKLLPDETKDIVKYWCQRYLLFSKFDKGVKMDQEGWFSVTPEAIARHHALRCGSGIVIDCFAGVGGNAIQLAMKSNHVIAIDIDPQKINYARHNATIYGVNDRIDFIQGDFFSLAANLKGDTVFLSPPWGGPEYARVQAYDIRTMLKPHDGYFVFEIAKMIAPRVVMFLPRNVDIGQLAELLLAHPPWELEVEKNYLNGKLKGITAYFSDASR